MAVWFGSSVLDPAVLQNALHMINVSALSAIVRPIASKLSSKKL